MLVLASVWMLMQTYCPNTSLVRTSSDLVLWSALHSTCTIQFSMARLLPSCAKGTSHVTEQEWVSVDLLACEATLFLCTNRETPSLAHNPLRCSGAATTMQLIAVRAHGAAALCAKWKALVLLSLVGRSVRRSGKRDGRFCHFFKHLDCARLDFVHHIVFTQSLNLSTSPPINQSISQSVKQSISQSVRESVSQSVSQSISQYQSISVNISQYQSISFNISQYQSITVNICQYQSKSVNISHYQLISVIISQYQSISVNVSQYQSITVNYSQ